MKKLFDKDTKASVAVLLFWATLLAFMGVAMGFGAHFLGAFMLMILALSSASLLVITTAAVWNFFQ